MHGPSTLDDSLYWTRQRKELVQWFDDRAPSFVECYKGAVRLLHDPEFPARVRFICHAARDIYRYLPPTLGAQPLPRPGEVFPGMVKSLAQKWDRFPPAETETPGQVDSDPRVSPQVCRYLIKLVAKSRDLKDQPSVGKELAIALFRSLDRGHDEFIHPWIIDAFDEEYVFFVSRAHSTKNSARVPSDIGLTAHFEAFERSFHALIGPYFSGKEELDVILQDANSTAD